MAYAFNDDKSKYELEFVTRTFSKYYSLAANAVISDSIDISVDGYTPIGIAGFDTNIATSDVIASGVTISTQDNTVNYRLKNFGTGSRSNYFIVDVTYIKN